MTDARIGIVCTDKGQHAWTSLGDLSWRDGLLRANISAVYGEHADRRKSESVWLDHLDKSKAEYHVNMRCPRCRRHVQWSHPTAMSMLSRLEESGVSQLDISRLP